MIQPRTLLRFIRSHGNPCYLRPDGRIRVAGWYTLDGRVGYEQVDLPATLQAVRDWLGY